MRQLGKFEGFAVKRMRDGSLSAFYAERSTGHRLESDVLFAE